MSTSPTVEWSTPLRLGSEPMSLPQFSFVQQSKNVNASITRRAVRSHAMRVVRRHQRHESAKTFRLKWPEERKKRQEATHPEEDIQKRLQDGGIVSGNPAPEWPEPVRPLYKFDPPQTYFPSSLNTPSEALSSLFSLGRQESSPYITPEVDEVFAPIGVSARTVLGAGRIDPFQTLPIRTTHRVAELVDQYTTIMPATFYGVRCRRPIHIDLYRIAIDHSRSTHAMAAYASKSLDFLNCSEASQSTLSHTMRAVQGVNEGLLSTKQDRTERDDGVILSIALLALAELRFGKKDIARQHWFGLREVVRYRGGFGTLHCNPSLKAVLAWNSTVWSASRYSRDLASPNLPSLVAPETPKDLRQACQDFIDFLYKLNDNAYSHSVYSDRDDSSHTAYPYMISPTAYKLSLFASGTPLYRLLSSNSSSSIGLGNQRASDACQTPCLLYINAMLLYYANVPYLIDNFFAKLINAVYEDNLDTCVSPEHLFVRLLVGIDGTEAERDARLCEVTRLAYVAKRLGTSSMEIVRGALWRNLVVTDGPCRRERLFTWDPGMLEAEILRD